MSHVLDLQSIDPTGSIGSPLVSNYSWAACEDSTVSIVLCQHPHQPE
ncbi:class III lanthipeptide [Micromonospora sp. NPDC023956]